MGLCSHTLTFNIYLGISFSILNNLGEKGTKFVEICNNELYFKMSIRLSEGIFAVLPESCIYSVIAFQYNFAFASYEAK